MIDYLTVNLFGILLSIILPYFIVYFYNKSKNKIIKWRAGILFADYLFFVIVINSIIIAIMTPILFTLALTNFILVYLVSIIVFIIFNLICAVAGNEFKKQGKNFLRNFAIFLIVLIIFSIIGLKGINVIHIVFIALIIFNLYFYTTLDLEKIEINTHNQTSKENNNDTSMKKLQEKYDTLRKLKSLYDDKIITKEEYEKEREKILKS